MMIAAFARESRLSVDAVRLYVRRGLLQPETGTKGGSRPYQIFSALDIEKARIIRAGQALGLSLKEIGVFLNKRAFDGNEDDVVIAFLAEQRDRLTGRISDLEKLVSFVDAKIAWLQDPSIGPSPPYPH
ncbi:MerR family transcriptional regulator [Rhodopila sp.]|uniref:helix-turn-helix domain-containing protein n=1 Tax=Rhodopila sp. TaxID=2480087 RepID=UPI003D0C9A1D